MEYSAREVAELLKKEGFNVSTRTINYYAFEKKMFDITITGKKCFTKNEINKIKAIKGLQETTNFTLEQIKEIINKYSLEEIFSRIVPISYQNVQDFYTSAPYTYSLESDGLSVNFLKDISNLVPQYSASTSTKSYSEVNSISVGNNAFGKSRTIKVNKDLTLLVSENITSEELSKIIDSINRILKK